MDAVGYQIHPVRTDLGGQPTEIVPVIDGDHRTDLEHQYRLTGNLIDHFDHRPVMFGRELVVVGDLTTQRFQGVPPPHIQQPVVPLLLNTSTLVSLFHPNLAFRISLSTFPMPSPILALPSRLRGPLTDLAFLFDQLPTHRATGIFHCLFHTQPTFATLLIRRYRVKTPAAN